MLLKDEQRKMAIEMLREFIDKSCIFRANPEVKYNECCPAGELPSAFPGPHSTWQFYLRNLTHNPQMLLAISCLFFDDLYTKIEAGDIPEHYQLCGLETSSIPIMIGMQNYAMSRGVMVNSFSIRKERKAYGLFNFVDGRPTEAPVIVVDDVINSGGSIRHVLDVCKYELGLSTAKNIYSIIKFREDMDQVEFEGERMNVVSIFGKSDFSYDFDPEKYWMPKDVDRDVCNRPDYI